MFGFEGSAAFGPFGFEEPAAFVSLIATPSMYSMCAPGRPPKECPDRLHCKSVERLLPLASDPGVLFLASIVAVAMA